MAGQAGGQQANTDAAASRTRALPAARAVGLPGEARGTVRTGAGMGPPGAAIGAGLRPGRRMPGGGPGASPRA
eukprot:14646240-Alexandrium_andersonii.AAC.1